MLDDPNKYREPYYAFLEKRTDDYSGGIGALSMVLVFQTIALGWPFYTIADTIASVMLGIVSWAAFHSHPTINLEKF